MAYKVRFTKQAAKDYRLLRSSPAILKRLDKLIGIIGVNPFQSPPLYEKLSGDLEGYYSRRLNIKHRLVYEVLESEIKVLAIWSHYENL